MIHRRKTGQFVVSEFGLLKKLLLVQPTGACQLVFVNVHGQQIMKEPKRREIAKFVLGQVDVTKMLECPQHVDVGQASGILMADRAINLIPFIGIR